MKFGQLIEYKSETFSFRNHTENESGRLVPDFFLFFKKPLNEVKASGLQLSFNITSIALNFANNKNKLYNTLDYTDREKCSILIF